MSVLIRLLGPPAISDDAGPRRLSGRKPWGVLAMLALAPPSSRRSIVDLLFGEADDPLAALRWSLHQVRRAIGPEAEIVEEDGRLRLRLLDALVDVQAVLSEVPHPDTVEELLGGELLEGVDFDESPEFDQWLLLERARVSEASFAAVWSAASAIARSDPDRALRLVQRGLHTKPFCVGTNELAVDIMVRQNDLQRARDYVDKLERRWRTEFGEPLPASIRRPIDRASTPFAAGLGREAGPLLETARARMAAGDYRGAIETARRAAEAADGGADPVIELEAMLTLIGILVHSVRGLDEEAKGLIATAAAIAAELGDEGSLSDAMREAGYVHMLEANYGGAEVALRQAVTHARVAGDPLREGKALTYLALVASDRGAFVEAEPLAREAVERLEQVGDRGWVGYALAVASRILLRTGRHDEAEEVARRGVEAVREANWVAILPWPMVMAGEAAFRTGALERSEAVFAEALTIGSEIQDPCWEGLALRGLALVAAERGDRDRAVALLEDAHACTQRFVDIYRWAEAVILTDLVELEGGSNPEHLSDALDLALNAPMTDLAERLLSFRPSHTTIRTGRLPGQTLPQTARA